MLALEKRRVELSDENARKCRYCGEKAPADMGETAADICPFCSSALRRGQETILCPICKGEHFARHVDERHVFVMCRGIPTSLEHSALRAAEHNPGLG